VRFNEDTLVQQTTADYLRDELGWESIYAYNDETFGPEGTLGRKDDREIVLTRYLGEALITLNPGLPQEAYQDAIRQITAYSLSQSPLQINQEKHDLLRGGVQVSFRDDKGELVKRRLRVFDFDEPANNHFLAVRELWVRGVLYRRRADVIGFVNGLPLLFMELKNVHKDIRAAYDRNLADYKDTIPHLFHHNAVIVLGNGIAAKLGSLSSRYEHFHEWKRLDEDEPGVVDMETLLKGVCNKRNFLDLFENFIVFDDSSGKLVKIVARNHQFLGVNKALQAVRERKERLGKLGVFWHTQGSGKSYSMVFFTRKIHRKLGFLTERGFRLDDILERTGFGRNRAIIEAKEVVNENDESRKRFEILAREVFKKFKACITLKGVNDHRRQYDAINIIYASLQADRENADITDILRKLHAVVDQAIEPRGAESGPESSVVYDISQIDFERLRKEFERSPTKNTTVQNLKEVVEKRLFRMIQQNPLRMDFQRHYEEIIKEYNREKDRAAIEQTFEELLKFVSALDKESTRALREGLDEETLALFDLLTKPELPKKDLERLKQVAAELLAQLKAEKLRADNWWNKQATRDAVKVEIRDFLWNDETGLPLACYSEQDVEEKAEQVYLHVFRLYAEQSFALQ
jgi:type I site-specific restriction-modification system R (restriction) subunit